VNHRETVLRLFSIYCATSGRSASRVSTLIWNHGARHRQISRGADLRTRSFEHALRWFSARWPEHLPWPQGIVRPEPTQQAGADATAPDAEREPSLREAMALGPNARLRSPAALCKALRIRRTTYDYVVRRYSDVGDRADAVPQRDTWTRRLLDHLVASGDERFALRRARVEKAARIGRRYLETRDPEGPPPDREPDAD
jgi:hypothetical protein